MNDFMLMRSGAIVNTRLGYRLYEAHELAHLSQTQREHLARLHNEDSGLEKGDALEVLAIWEREGLG